MARASVVQRIAYLVLVTLLATACTVGEDGMSAGAPGASQPATDQEAEDGLVPLAPPTADAAAPGELVVEHVDGDDHVQVALEVSRSSWEAAETAVLVASGSVPDAAVAAPLAAALGAPLLATGSQALTPAVRSELERLGATTAMVIGGVSQAAIDGLGDAGLDVQQLSGADRTATSALVAEQVPPVGRVYLAGADDAPAALAASAAGTRLAAPVLLVDGDAGGGLRDEVAGAVEVLRPAEAVIVGSASDVPSSVRAALAARDHAVERISAETPEALSAAVTAHLAGDAGAPADWVVAAADGPREAAAALSVSAATGGSLLLVDADDPGTSEEVVDVLDGAGGRLRLVGASLGRAMPRQLRAVAAGNLLPRGGTVLFPAHRMVAYYGNAQYSVLGVLGETSPDEAAETVEEIAAQYDDGERTVLPAFELIVSIALAQPGPDGQFSDLGPIADARRYLDVARAHDQYLFLDFQPGRNRFLDQVEAYEELLREPDVGVALDPEWRMTDSQRPGQVIGSVEADEVNEVAEYLAEIVRDHDLPQKLFVVHQFRFDMINDRDAVVTPPELATTIHVDGFGTQDLKLQTWNALASAQAPWFHGFKLFYDEDTDLFSPEQIIDFDDPPVDLVTYQ